MFLVVKLFIATACVCVRAHQGFSSPLLSFACEEEGTLERRLLQFKAQKAFHRLSMHEDDGGASPALVPTAGSYSHLSALSDDGLEKDEPAFQRVVITGSQDMDAEAKQVWRACGSVTCCG